MDETAISRPMMASGRISFFCIFRLLPLKRSIAARMGRAIRYLKNNTEDGSMSLYSGSANNGFMP